MVEHSFFKHTFEETVKKIVFDKTSLKTKKNNEKQIKPRFSFSFTSFCCFLLCCLAVSIVFHSTQRLTVPLCLCSQTVHCV